MGGGGGDDRRVSRLQGTLSCTGTEWWLRNEGRLPLRLLVQHNSGELVRDSESWQLVAELVRHDATFNGGTGGATSIRTVAGLVRGHFPGTAFLETPMPPGDPLGGYASTRHLKHVLDWQPVVAVADGVARYVKWLQQIPAAVPVWLSEEAGVAR